MNKRIAAIICAMFAIAALCLYIVVAVYYGRHLYPHTTVNGRDFSNAEKAEVLDDFLESQKSYVLQISGRDLNTFENTELLQITAEDVALKYLVGDADIEEILRNQKNRIWPLYIWKEHDCRLQESVEIDEEKLEAVLATQDFFRTDKMTTPKDAYIEDYDVEQGEFILVPEVKGTQIDQNVVRGKIIEAMLQGIDTVDLEAQNCYMEPSVTADDEDIQQNLTRADKWLETRINYDWNGTEIVLETDFVSGNMSNGCVTPEGVFGLTYKTTNAVLRGADYVTPVSYWMPFNGNVGMHDATWRTEFGGDIYLNDGSHGCLNLPLDKAEEIYQYMKEGFPIICYYYPPDTLTQSDSELPEE